MISFGTDFQMPLIITFDVHVKFNRLEFYSSEIGNIRTKQMNSKHTLHYLPDTEYDKKLDFSGEHP